MVRIISPRIRELYLSLISGLNESYTSSSLQSFEFFRNHLNAQKCAFIEITDNLLAPIPNGRRFHSVTGIQSRMGYGESRRGFYDDIFMLHPRSYPVPTRHSAVTQSPRNCSLNSNVAYMLYAMLLSNVSSLFVLKFSNCLAFLREHLAL